jgi:hypothetical protein
LKREALAGQAAPRPITLTCCLQDLDDRFDDLDDRFDDDDDRFDDDDDDDDRK